MREIKMLPTNTFCFNSDETRGRSACYLRKWIQRRLLEPYNCTLFYLHYRTQDANICEHGIVPKNYKEFQSLSMNGTNCLPSCSRHDRRYRLYSNEVKHNRPRFTKINVDFRLEIGYRDLEYEIYEEYKPTTLLGFVSELGGQFGLFAGVTIITVIQLILNLILLSTKHVEKCIKRLFSR